MKEGCATTILFFWAEAQNFPADASKKEQRSHLLEVAEAI
jgi:hypothetical protein